MSINHAVVEALVEKHHDYRKLHDEHAQLERRIHELKATPTADFVQLTQLKRQKLYVRDQMAQIARMH